MPIGEPSVVHEARPGRVIFGWGARGAVGAELARLGIERVMIVSTPSRADLAAEFARFVLDRVGIVYPGAQPGAPVEVTEAALTAASSVKADGLIAIGGGTAIGLSKAISLRTNLPQVVAPTTFSGCEMAPVVSEAERGARIERRSRDVLPKTTVYDPELVAHLPPSVAGPSAMNAMANALDAMCAPDARPVDALAATEAMRMISAALPRFLGDPANKAAWSDALYGAWLAGAGVGRPTLHSKICQTLVDELGLIHADVNCLMLPYTAAYRRERHSDALRKVAAAIGTEDAPQALFDLMRLAGPRNSLRRMEVRKDDIETLCDRMQVFGDGVSASRADCLEILTGAYKGRRP
jgi:alcohol dehydrogenase class IV